MVPPTQQDTIRPREEGDSDPGGNTRSLGDRVRGQLQKDRACVRHLCACEGEFYVPTWLGVECPIFGQALFWVLL